MKEERINSNQDRLDHVNALSPMQLGLGIVLIIVGVFGAILFSGFMGFLSVIGLVLLAKSMV